MYAWTADIPIKKKKYHHVEYIVNEKGIFTKSDYRDADTSFLNVMWQSGIPGRLLLPGKNYIGVPAGRCAILWRKVSDVKGDEKAGIIRIKGNAESEIELSASPEMYREVLAYIDEMRAKNPVKRGPDDEAARWFCWGLDEDWEENTPLPEMIEKELREASKRIIEEDSLDATVIG